MYLKDRSERVRISTQIYAKCFRAFSRRYSRKFASIIMFEEKIPLSKYSNYKIGGLARYFFEARSVEEIIRAVEKAQRMKIRVFVLGGGTNILFSDKGFNGLILKPNIQFIKREGNLLRVGAGVLITQLLNNLITNNLTGLEWAAGLPGTLGGAIRGNAGSFGGEMKDIIKEVVSLDISKPGREIIKRNNQDCDFGYRSSVFKANKGREIIIEATLIFKKGEKKLIQEIAEKNINYRKAHQPLEYPNIGSIFKNVPLTQIDADISVNQRTHQRLSAFPIKKDPFPVIPAAHLISEAGLKGISYGGAMISSKHPNFIVNVLGATAKDIKNLIQLAKKEVKKKFNIELEEEIIRL